MESHLKYSIYAHPDDIVQIPQDAILFRGFVDKFAPRISQDSLEDTMKTFVAAIERVVVILLKGKRREVLQTQGVVAHDDWTPRLTVKGSTQRGTDVAGLSDLDVVFENDIHSSIHRQDLASLVKQLISEFKRQKFRFGKDGVIATRSGIKCTTKRAAKTYELTGLHGIFRDQAESIMYIDVGFKVTSHAMYSLWPSLFLLGPEEDEKEEVEGFACTFFAAFPDAAVVARLAKLLVRSFCSVRVPGIYIEFCVYKAAIELGLITVPVCDTCEFGHLFMMRSPGHMISDICDPYQLFKKTADMLHEFEGLCSEEWAFLANPHCYRGGDWEDHFPGKIFRKAAVELRTFFGRAEAVTQFDPACEALVLPRACEDLVLPASFQLTEVDLHETSLDELRSAQADAEAMIERAQQLQATLAKEIAARLA